VKRKAIHPRPRAQPTRARAPSCHEVSRLPRTARPAPLDAIDVSMLGDEPEEEDRIVSWAKSAAALRKISRSVHNSAFSLRTRRSSSNSEPATANGSACRASSASCAATQFRNVVSFTPNRRATAVRDSSLASTNCTASRRNSSGYLGGRPNRTPSSGLTPESGVHRTGSTPMQVCTAAVRTAPSPQATVTRRETGTIDPSLAASARATRASRGDRVTTWPRKRRRPYRSTRGGAGCGSWRSRRSARRRSSWLSFGRWTQLP